MSEELGWEEQCRQQAGRIEALEAEVQRYAAEAVLAIYRVEALEALLEAPTKEEIALYARIEALEAALRDNEIVRNIAALDEDATK